METAYCGTDSPINTVFYLRFYSLQLFICNAYKIEWLFQSEIDAGLV
uniref:Uncharacterized protein n=1 Tax=Anguilla anguilla TaxID=7936 RepID=A0A0E9RSB5_ANGAN